jgi:RHS repeat-associated protein
VWEAVYDPFGEADVNPNSSVVNDFRFPGQYFDCETGLHYNYYRFYNPRTGRYITPDPIGQGGRINLYPYVSDNPINYIDSSGLLLWYADKQSEKIMKPYIQKIMKTQKGRELLKKLHNDPQIYLIHGKAGQYGPAYQLGRDVFVDPCFQPMIQTDKGLKPASTTRILAHELGHLTGIKDDGPGRMNNVNTWENPIMHPLEGFYRTKY